MMANPPFNVNRIEKARLEGDRRFPFGLPRADNGNYIWIQLFYSALNHHGRAGFVMANSAADAGGSELEIRAQLIEQRAVDVIVSICSNFFHTVTLPCTLWFLDKGQVGDGARGQRALHRRTQHLPPDRPRAPRVPARADRVPRQHRAALSRRGPREPPRRRRPHGAALPRRRYADVPGLCRVATIDEIEAQGWSLNPGRYVGVAAGETEQVDFRERLRS